MAGANPDAKPDYRTQALTELNKLESKVILLNEMLDNVDVARGERFVQGDVYDVRVIFSNKCGMTHIPCSKWPIYWLVLGLKFRAGSRMRKPMTQSL